MEPVVHPSLHLLQLSHKCPLFQRQVFRVVGKPQLRHLVERRILDIECIHFISWTEMETAIENWREGTTIRISVPSNSDLS